MLKYKTMKLHKESIASKGYLLILIIVTGLFMFVMKSASAQMMNNNSNEFLTTLEENISSNNELEAIYNSENVYLKWIIEDQKEDCMFIIQKSEDGKKYETIGFKKGIGNNSSLEILYCFTDEIIKSDLQYYRIGQISKNGNISYSNIKEVYEPRKVKQHDDIIVFTEG